MDIEMNENFYLKQFLNIHIKYLFKNYTINDILNKTI